jgi:hypothetical protein
MQRIRRRQGHSGSGRSGAHAMQLTCSRPLPPLRRSSPRSAIFSRAPDVLLRRQMTAQLIAIGDLGEERRGEDSPAADDRLQAQSEDAPRQAGTFDCRQHSHIEVEVVEREESSGGRCRSRVARRSSEHESVVEFKCTRHLLIEQSSRFIAASAYIFHRIFDLANLCIARSGKRDAQLAIDRSCLHEFCKSADCENHACAACRRIPRLRIASVRVVDICSSSTLRHFARISKAVAKTDSNKLISISVRVSLWTSTAQRHACWGRQIGGDSTSRPKALPRAESANYPSIPSRSCHRQRV